jgi:magnesium-transporting ATPase (P-type)
MIAKQKQKGLKTVIVCKKGLSTEQVLSYTKEYAKISSSARDQIEDLETLASQIELDLEYVGCVGFRDSIREEALTLSKKLQEAMLTISIMSGDELENCLTVVNKLGLSHIDIQNSSSFYWIHASNEKQILQELRRIFGKIHDLLQNESYQAIEDLLKTEGENQNETEHQKSLNHHVKHDRPKAIMNQPENKEEVKHKVKVTFETVQAFKRPILLNGASLDCIMSSPLLKAHLAAVLQASGSIVAYGLRPKHKAFLTDLLMSCGDTVLAVGDGFNDIGMLSRASFGVQISNPDVPLTFGDVVVPSLSHILPLMMEYGFPLKKNLLYSYILIVWMSASTAIAACLISIMTFFYLPFRTNEATTIGFNLIYIFATVFAIFNPSYNSEILIRFPAIYRENAILKDSLVNILLCIVLLSLIEGSLITLSINYFMSSDLNSSGYTHSMEENFNRSGHSVSSCLVA